MSNLSVQMKRIDCYLHLLRQFGHQFPLVFFTSAAFPVEMIFVFDICNSTQDNGAVLIRTEEELSVIDKHYNKSCLI